MPINLGGNTLNSLGTKLLNDTSAVTSGSVLYLDAGIATSYGGSDTTWTDLTSNANNGTLTNGPTYTTASGGAIVFDGTNDYVSIPYNTAMDPTEGITIEAWIYPTDITSIAYQEIFRKENATARQLFAFQNNGTILSFGTYTSVSGYDELDVSITSGSYTNQWVHVVSTYLSSTGVKTIYRNASSIGTNTVSGTLNQGNATYYIGSSSGTSEYFTGRIATIRMYNRGLSATEILQNYQAQRQRFGL